ncbi:MAG: beta-L-arabinofuranosidase domain-containing protein, partial [Flavitalea sp.]
DGYLYTFRTMKAKKPHPWVGSQRWEKEEDLSHELYNSGHLFEAAVAHYEATGKKNLLNIAIKNADLLDKDFGWGKIEKFPGHQIVETGLVKLYRATGNKKYLDLAKFFLDVRGPGKKDSKEYNQANKKVIDQHEAVGHAVRATYMYAGMADVSALTGDKRYLEAIDDIWQDVVLHKLYLTGGIGATGEGEAFGKPYQLPNMSAYAETCASIANVYWNNRMFLLHGDSKYIDVLEKVLYNGLLSGISLSGNRFFYPNPLASVGQHQRAAWFDCACCISNMTRFLPSVPGYVYAQNKNDLYVNLFMGNTADVKLDVTKVNIAQTTEYPWKGNVSLAITPEKSAEFAVNIRIPGWLNNEAVPGDLYRFADSAKQPVKIKVNGKETSYKLVKGYAVIKRKWAKGDKVEFELPLEVQHVFANANVKDDVGRFALQRGPIVYCLEGPDNADSSVHNIVVKQNAAVQVKYEPALLNGVNVLTMEGEATKRQLNTDVLLKKTQPVYAIPYYSWANRGSTEMTVWIPFEESAARPKAAPTIASLSTVSSSLANKRMNKSLNDQYDPVDSKDHAAPYLHWWPKQKSTEWVQYDFAKQEKISETSVYWYDDGPWGGCRVPASVKVLYLKDGNWLPVTMKQADPIAKDKYNKFVFEPVETSALRLEIQLPVDNSAGIHEWSVK